MGAPNTVTTSQLVYVGNKNADGLCVGQSGGKVGFYGTAPIAQRSSASQAAVATTAAVAITSVTTGAYAYASSTQANAIITLVNELRAALVALGAIKGSA